MGKVSIGRIQYDTADLTNEEKARLARLQLYDVEVQRLKAEAAAHMASLDAFEFTISKIAQEIVGRRKQKVIPKNAGDPEAASAMVGLFSGRFGKR